MMRKTINKLPCFTHHILLCVVFTSALLWGEISFAGRIDKTKLSLDDQFTITVEASGSEVSQNMPEPQIGNFVNFRLLDKRASMTSSSSVRIIVNGKDMSKESEKKVTWEYVFAPKTVGRFETPSFTLNFNDRSYPINPITIEVTKEEVQNQDVIFRCIPQKNRVSVGEQFRLTVQIAIKQGANAFNPKRPAMEEELRKKFWVESLLDGEIKGTSKMIDGTQYTVFDIPFALYPVQSGEVVIPSLLLQYEEQQQTRDRRSVFDDPFFSGFFGRGVRSIPKQKSSRPVTITVDELPQAPQNFSGSVGKYTLGSEVDKTTLPAGDALTYTITIRGNSNLKNSKDPVIPSLSGFDVFEPEKKTRTQITSGVMWGVREYKYVLIPQREGTFTLQPASYIYFDTDSKSYKTLQSKPFTIVVTPGKRNAVSSGNHTLLTRQEIKQLGQDIRFIKTGDIKITASARPLHRNPAYLLLHLIPLFSVIGSYLFKKQRQKLTEDIGYARRSRSKKLVRKQLAEAKGHLKAQQAGAFYSALTKGIIGYIGDSLNVAATGMTSGGLKTLLVEQKQETATIDGILQILEKADLARFSSAGIQLAELQHDLELAETLLNSLNWKKK
jgi:hypothetical protein